HVSESWKVPEEIVAAQKAGRVLGASAIVIDSPGGKLEAAELIFENGAALEKVGVNVCFHTDDPITDSRLFLRSPALAVRAGMGRAAALRSVTLAAADMMDLGDRIGSLEAGKDADFVVLSGDPLSVYTRVERTFVEGRQVFDLALPADRLYAEGGFGAGHDQSPYMCCAGGIASGWAWRSQQGGQQGGQRAAGGQQENGQ
ncbi:MAG: amidohydrolase family protein, partial [Phycisphaerales bacterium]|nr:amidohydrolase family protein [Phycisphaerales bacterium]